MNEMKGYQFEDSEWLRAKHVQDIDRVAFEMKCLAECLYVAGTYDQLNVASLGCLEVISRRMQGIVEAYASGSPGQPDWHCARVITSYRGPDEAIAPGLRSWAAKKNKEETELAQTRAKFREHRKGLTMVRGCGSQRRSGRCLTSTGEGQSQGQGPWRGLGAVREAWRRRSRASPSSAINPGIAGYQTHRSPVISSRFQSPLVRSRP